MDKKSGLNIPKESSLEEIDVPFVYGGKSGEQIESHGVVAISNEDNTYEILRVFPNEIDDEWPKQDIRSWMEDNYPEYTEVK